jgi:tetratricopeptide (TPR) repeat protein
VAGALRLQQRALRVREELAAADPGSRRAKSDVCWGHQSTGDALLRAGQARAALDHFRRALEILPALASPADPAVAAQHAHLLVRSGDAHAALAGRGGGAASRDWQAAEAAYREALGLAEDLDRRGLLKLDDRGLPERARSGLRACRRALGARPS